MLEHVQDENRAKRANLIEDSHVCRLFKIGDEIHVRSALHIRAVIEKPVRLHKRAARLALIACPKLENRSAQSRRCG